MQENQKLVDHLFRHQYGKMVAVLMRLLGPHHLDLAEDVVQESFTKALSSWKINGIPERPEAWLMQVAKNAAVDHFRKENLRKAKRPELEASGPSFISIQNLFLDDEIADAQLRMIFCCCDPLIKPQDQIAITLKIVSGFSNREIADALFLKEETVKKRIQRAKVQLQKSWQPFVFPSGEDLVPRMDSVLKVIYLLFNEGYHSVSHEIVLRQELCMEAMRLGNIFCQHPKIKHPDAFALMGLMCFHAARFETRFNQEEEIILLEDQDRNLWSPELMMQGHHFMNLATQTEKFSAYHLQAAITGEYMMAPTFAKTRWSRILNFYDQLAILEPSAFLEMNRAVVHLYNDDFESAQTTLDDIVPKDLARREYLYHAIQAQIFIKQDRREAAIDAWLLAHNMAPSQKEKNLFEKKIKSYSE